MARVRDIPKMKRDKFVSCIHTTEYQEALRRTVRQMAEAMRVFDKSGYEGLKVLLPYASHPKE